jgi:hypothetical protein
MPKNTENMGLMVNADDIKITISEDKGKNVVQP